MPRWKTFLTININVGVIGVTILKKCPQQTVAQLPESLTFVVITCHSMRRQHMMVRHFERNARGTHAQASYPHTHSHLPSANTKEEEKCDLVRTMRCFALGSGRPSSNTDTDCASPAGFTGSGGRARGTLFGRHFDKVVHRIWARTTCCVSDISTPSKVKTPLNNIHLQHVM